MERTGCPALFGCGTSGSFGRCLTAPARMWERLAKAVFGCCTALYPVEKWERMCRCRLDLLLGGKRGVPLSAIAFAACFAKPIASTSSRCWNCFVHAPMRSR